MDLRHFTASAAQGGFNRAARAPHFGQSALSRQVMDLAEGIGVKLEATRAFSPALVAANLVVGCPDEHPNVDAESFARPLCDRGERPQPIKRP
jgi:hypothetical protein